MDDNNISSVCNSRDGRADEGRSTPPGIEFSCGRDGQVDDGLLVGTVSFSVSSTESAVDFVPWTCRRSPVRV